MDKAEAMEILSADRGEPSKDEDFIAAYGGACTVGRFVDSMIEHGVTAEDLKKWLSRNPSYKSDGPLFACATIMMPLWSRGSFSGYSIVPGEQKFDRGDASYFVAAALQACGMSDAYDRIVEIDGLCNEMLAGRRVESDSLPASEEELVPF